MLVLHGEIYEISMVTDLAFQFLIKRISKKINIFLIKYIQK